LKKYKTLVHYMLINALMPATALLTPTACSVFDHRAPEPAPQSRALYHAEDWVPVPAGEFLMGASADDNAGKENEKPQHQVKITQPLKMGRYEVTFEEYERFADATKRALPDDAGFNAGDRRRLPVIHVSWDDANAYADWLSRETGRHFRLPTEAEWEYAARAGTTGSRFWGDDPAQACQFANVFDRRNEVKIRQRFNVPKAWAANHDCADSYFAIAPVGSFRANPWGLHDMLGNVWEWVQDCRHDHYQGAPTAAHPAWEAQDSGTCSKRGVRGGSWFVAVPYVRAAHRSWNFPTDKGSGIGFRLIQD